MKSELGKEKKLRTTTENSVREAQQTNKQCRREHMALSDQHENDCSRYNRELVKAKEILDKLQRQVSSLTASNAVCRLIMTTAALAKEKGTIDQLKVDIQSLKHELLKLNGERLEKQRENKNKNKTE